MFIYSLDLVETSKGMCNSHTHCTPYNTLGVNYYDLLRLFTQGKFMLLFTNFLASLFPRDYHHDN